MCPMMERMTEKPHRTAYRIYDIVTQFSGNDFPDLRITVDGDTIATSEEVRVLWYKYTEWIYSQSDLQHFMIADTQQEIMGGYIFAEWQLFVQRNGVNLKRMLDALFAEYDPISNYDMIEQGADGEKQDAHRVTPSGKVTVTNTPYATGVNSSGDGAKLGKSVTETTYENSESETSYDNTMSIKNNHDQPETGYHHATQHYLKRSGNIGVTTSAQMIAGELELRVVDLLSDFVKRFFDQYCYYVG